LLGDVAVDLERTFGWNAFHFAFQRTAEIVQALTRLASPQTTLLRVDRVAAPPARSATFPPGRSDSRDSLPIMTRGWLAIYALRAT
jgi:hypothetical protein